MSDDHDAFFMDTLDEGARFGLLCVMTGISEQFYAAGWESGLEFSLWRMVCGGARDYGLGEISERQVQLLRLLSEEAGGWWAWDEERGEHFMNRKEWLVKVAMERP